MLKIGVFGVGHLGKIHVKCLQMLPDVFDLVGFYDPDDATAARVEEAFGIKRFATPQALIQEVEVVDIVTPTIYHFEMAATAIRAGCHVFIEKPLTHTLEEARQLLDLHKEYPVQIQVGHVERFNPALLALGTAKVNPMFVEAHRLATFNPRGTDVSVVLDLMIHDLDIVLSMVDSKVSFISASGVPVVSKTPDIANARIEFENGCVANLTASRISLKQMRKLRFFQKDAYISLDLLEKEAQVVRMYDEGAPTIPKQANLLPLPTPDGLKMIHLQQPEIQPINAIKMELATFAESIQAQSSPRVSVEDGYKALSLAYQIIEEIEKRTRQITI